MKHLRTFGILIALSTTAWAQNEPGWATAPPIPPADVVAWADSQTGRSEAPSGIESREMPAHASSPLEVAMSLGQAESEDAGNIVLMSLMSSGNEADEITPPIAELAAGLRNDPLRIYEYVYNNIEFEPYFGSKKGAHLTLLEGSGNEFDQASLLVALLRAAGLSPTYHYGPCYFSYSEIVSWMGLSSTPFDHWTDSQFAAYYGFTDTSPGNIARLREWVAVFELLNPKGYFYFEPFQSGGENFFSIPHVWVEVVAGGSNRRVSPSFKFYEDVAGIDLPSAMGYSRTQILSEAGGTTGSPDWVTGLNESAINARLGTLTQNLLDELRDNHHEASVAEVLGGRKVLPQVFTSWGQIPAVLRDGIAAGDWLPFESWSEVPELHMSKVQLVAGIRNAGNTAWTTTWFDEELTMPSLQGRKLSLTFDGTSGRIHLDEDLVGSAFSMPGGTTELSLGITATHNHYRLVFQSGNYVVVDAGRSDQTEVKPHLVSNDYAHVVVYSFSNPDKLRREREEVLDGYRRAGVPESDWRVRSELLNLMGLTWFYQTWQQTKLIETQFNMIDFYLHRFGRVSQEQSFFIDVAVQFAAISHRAMNFEKAEQFNYFTAFFASAMEHGVIEQLQGPGVNGVSTVKLMKRTNDLGRRIYRATSSNWTSINSELNANVPTSDRTKIQEAVNAGGRVLLPRNAVIPVDDWDGFGYGIELAESVQMLISGGLFGGYSSQQGSVTFSPIWEQATNDPTYNLSGSTTLRPGAAAYSTPQQASFDPIDMASGAYLLDRTELVLGSGDAPRGLTFSRHYNSNLRYDQSAGLGYGWTHNYDISVTRRSSVKAGLGETITYHAAPFLVGMVVGGDLYAGHSNAKQWVTSALVVNWATDQLRYNAAAVSLGNKTIEFIRMPDGTFIAPANMNLTLTETSGIFQMTERHGSTMAFDADGRIATITNLHGKEQTFNYSGDHLSSVSDAWGRTLTFNRSGERINSVSDSTGRTVSFGYTGDDLTACTDVEGKVWTYEYDSDHRMTALSDPSSREIARNFYDGRSRVNEQWNMGDDTMAWRYYYSGFVTIEEDPLGGLTRYFYDSRARSIGVADALNHVEIFQYDGHDRRTAHTTRKGESTFFFNNKDNNPFLVIDPAGEAMGFVYDTELRLQTLFDKRGFSSNFTYSPQHQVLTATNPLSEVSTNTYDSDGNLLTSTDAETNTTTFAYDAYGEVNEIQHPDTTTHSFTRNARGDALTETDPLSQSTTFTYNARRQLLTTTAPGSAPATLSYNDEGMLAASTDALGNTMTRTYSASGKLLTLTLPTIAAGANIITHTYDVRDWLVTSTNSLGETVTNTHDAVGNPLTVTDPLGRTTTFAFDPNRRLTKSTDALTRESSSVYNQRGELITTVDPAAQSVSYVYDPNGNRKELTNRNNETFLFGYDNANRPTLTATPLGLETESAYTANGLLESTTQPGGAITAFEYDELLRLSEKTDPVGTVAYNHDAAGNLLTVTEGAATITRTYDARNRPLTVTDARGKTIGYQWDDESNLTRITYPGGKTVDYTYNERNQLSTVTDWNARVTSYTYDVTGRLTGVLRHNGTSAEYVYDDAGQVLQIKESSAGNLIRYRQLGYDAAGQMVSEFVAPLPREYELPVHTATYDADNRLATWNGQAVTLDDDGNLTSGPLLGVTHETYTYNTRNQLTGAGGLSYTYDAEGNRVSITDTEGTSHFVVDATAGSLSKVLIRETPDEALTYYVYGLGLLYEVDEAEQTRVHHYNLTGGTIARTDDEGKVVGQIEYSPYGMMVRSLGDVDTPFLFNGQFGVMTDANGLLNMRARYYNPNLLRFLNPDPIGFSGGLNWYAFADGNPISLLDPFGLSPTEGGLASFGKSVLLGVAGGINIVSAPLRVFMHPPGSSSGAQAMEDTLRMFAPPGFNETPEQFVAGVKESVSTPEAVIATGVAFAITRKLPAKKATNVTNAANAVEDFLGGQGQIIRNADGDVIIMLGNKKVRFDINNPHGDKPHFHIEQQTSSGRWRDAGAEHRYYFTEE